MTIQKAQATAPKRSLPPLMQLSEAAAERLKVLYQSDHTGKTLRIYISTKGCSGMKYEMEFVEKPSENDEIVTDKGMTILVDRQATLFLIGTVMDYQEDDLSSGFVFNNPNEKSRCGCGESFHV
ncbi:HesB/IscA family protein [Entomobacter blattae]|uniref:Iron-binding protein IscA n=1 Tax=Entomobacter blattae TaxID=2762277 RepID=A0A7H1NSV8_9PROT|nr:iron-sulfur cluster assembly accessory protein [Entomobacter blattae]QNT78868.1 Iron-binding protein IscA [Entomobacter blattae]